MAAAAIPSPSPDDKSSNDDDYIPGFSDLKRRVPADIPNVSREDTAADEPSSIPLVLALREDTPPRKGSLPWLAHILGLDLYGRTTMSDAARVEVQAVALILLVIFAFDLIAWCLLFYFVVNAGSLELNIGHMLFALGGILPAIALLLYERGFMISDTASDGWRRLVLPTSLRVIIIALAAWITAQPIELIAFARRIERRVHDERIREDLVTRYNDLLDHTRNRDKVQSGQAVLTDAEARRNIANDSLGQLILRRSAEEDTLASRERARDTAGRALELRSAALRDAATRAIQDGATAGDTVRWRKAEQDRVDAYRDHRRLVGLAAEQRREIARVQATTDFISSERNRQEQRAADAMTAASSEMEVDALRRWVRALRSSPPGHDFRDSLTNYEFKFVDYDFLEKLRILDDLREARPPRWPGASEKIRAALESEYGMYDPTDQRVLETDAANASRTYWAIFGIAIIVPFMSLLFKLIMPRHLSSYYSILWQARQGHPWALSLVPTERFEPTRRWMRSTTP